MADSSGAWCLIESDPGVFTELIHDFGVKDVQVTELYNLDSVELPRPVYGLIFLFKWVKEADTRPTADYDPATLFFAQQRIQNACATQAILSVLLNRHDIDLGPDLTQFREFTADFPPDLKGDAITNSDRIRAVHNSFSRLETMVLEDRQQPADGGEDVFHFISYVPVNGRLYELDGLKAGPIDLGPCQQEDWIPTARPHIEARMQRYASSELRFALMAVARDRRGACRAELAEIEPQLASATPEVLAALQQRQGQLLAEIAAEDELAERHARENARRKHNWLPFIFHLLRLMAENNRLSSK